MFVTTAIRPATLLVSAQMKPIIVPTTSTATIAASQYRICRLVMSRGYSYRSVSPHTCFAPQELKEAMQRSGVEGEPAFWLAGEA